MCCFSCLLCLRFEANVNMFFKGGVSGLRDTSIVVAFWSSKYRFQKAHVELDGLIFTSHVSKIYRIETKWRIIIIFFPYEVGSL